jgi:hypothetical protein
MLRELHLSGIGPAPSFDIEFGRRLNVLTGDNGLGKSFILEVAWWALTGTWADQPAAPRRDAPPRIRWAVEGRGGRTSRASVSFNRQSWSWPWRAGRPPMPGLTLYVRVDGSFSVWDPARNYWRNAEKQGLEGPGRPDAYHFQPEHVWKGLELQGETVCNGLIRDWVSWQRQHQIEGREDDPFSLLCRALQQLSPYPGQEVLTPGKPARISPKDVLEYPTLEFPYGTVSVVHASAGIRRILGLAYLLVWAWHEHLQAVELIGGKPETRLILLMDEVETHLHPQWQRRIMPALTEVLEALAPRMHVEAVVTTHSPLVLASLEPGFDPEQDKLFLFDLQRGKARLRELPWSRQGDILSWLTSPVFGLEQARSLEAEEAIEAAEAFMRGDAAQQPPGLRTHAQIQQRLQALLPDQAPFWPRWIVSSRKRS